MKLLISGNLDLNDEQKEILQLYADNIAYHTDEKQNVENCERYEYVICNNLFEFNDISKFSSLHTIQLISAGINERLKIYALNNGIKLFNAKNVYSIPIAEHTIMQILNIYRDGRLNVKNQEKRLWQKNRQAKELFGKNVCVLGYGNVGYEIAKRLDAFGCHMKILNRSKIESQYEYHSLDDIKKVVPECDVLIASIALTNETKGIVDREVLELLSPGSIFVNVSRGKIVDEEALYDVLSAKRIYAALDVFDNEPLDRESDLWEMENVYITPHSSFIGDKNNERLFDMIVNNLKKSWEG